MTRIGWLRRHSLEVVFAVYTAAMIVVTAIDLPVVGEVVPFHFVWGGLAFVYGFRVWSFRASALVLGAATVGSGAAYTAATIRQHEQYAELFEIALMPAIVAVLMWHAHRRAVAQTGLERALAYERDFVRHASHQLRTPISLARGYAELIADTATLEQARHDADVVLEELARLHRISDRLLMLATADDPESFARDGVDLTALAGVVEQRWRQAAARRWELDVDGAVPVVGDEERLRLALDALVENAIKFSREEDTITISTARGDGAALISVSDTGEGISGADLPHIFERFARKATVSRGTGLGLAFVHAVAEAHGGSVEVESRLGEGSRFTIRLPAAHSEGDGIGARRGLR